MNDVKKLIGEISMVLLLNVGVHGQAVTIDSMEIPLRYMGNPYTVIPASEQGFVLLSERFNQEDLNKKFWDVLLYNPDLERFSVLLIETEHMFGLFGHAYHDSKVYLLFAGIKDLKKQLYIHEIDLVKQTSQKIPIDTYLPDQISYFSNFFNSLIIGGRDQGKNSFIFFDLENKNLTILQGIFTRRSEILDIRQDASNQLFTMIITYVNNRNQIALNLRSYDPFGQPIEDIRIDPEDNVEFLNVRTIIVNNNLRFIGGTYRNIKMQHTGGVFLGSIQLDGNQTLTYYPLEEIFQLLDSMNGPDIKYTSSDLAHFLKEDVWNASQLYEIGKGNAIILEGFNNQRYYASTGNLKKIFVYDLGLIIGFNDHLEINWVNDFNMKNTITNEFDYHINLVDNGDRQKLYYFYLNRLNEKIINGPETIKPEYPVTLIYPEYKGDDPISYNNDLSKFQAWYDDYYLFSGVKSFEGPEGNPIFFVHKIAYR